MDAPAAVLALVLLEMAVGGLVFLWAAPTWGNLRHGYEVLQGLLLAAMAAGAWASLRGPLAVARDLGVPAATTGWAQRGLVACTLLAALSVLAIVLRQHALGRVVGVVATLVGLATFVPIAAVRADAGGSGGAVAGVAELVLGAVFLGAVWVGMVLGHWYLVERRLPNRFMVWIAWANVGAVVAGLVSVGLSARNPVPCAGLTAAAREACRAIYSPILSVGSFTVLLAVGLVALVALIAGFNVKLAREGGRSIQASTGMFYLAVILAPSAEFAAKLRYF